MKKSVFAPWLTRFYGWYLRSRRERPPRQENLCHFGRVVFFWAPLYWFFCRRLRLGMRPWMPVTLVMLGSLGAISPVFIASFAAAVAVTACSFFLIRFLTFPTFWEIRVTERVRLWMVLAVVLLAVPSYFWPGGTLTVLLIILGTVAGMGVVMGAGWLIYQSFKVGIRAVSWVWRRIPKPQIRVSLPAGGIVPQPVRHAAANVGGILSMAWHFLVALEHQTLCPWITFEDGRIEFYWSASPIESK